MSISFSKKRRYWQENCWKKSFRHLSLQRRPFTLSYDLRLTVSHFFFIILHSPHCVRLLLLLCHRRRFAFASCVDLHFALSATITASRSSDSNLAAYSK